MHCILKKKYINQYTTKIGNFLCFFVGFLNYYSVFFSFSNAWGRNLCNLPETENTNQNTWTWDMSTLLSQSYIGNTALLYTSKTKMGCPKTGCQILWPMSKKRTSPPPPSPLWTLHAECFSPWCGLAMVLKAQKRAALDKICSGGKQKKAIPVSFFFLY